MGPMSDREYVYAVSGEVIVCPACKSEDLTHSSVEIQGNNAFQQVTCQSCDHYWNDVYVLDGYTELTNGDGEVLTHEEGGMADVNRDLLEALETMRDAYGKLHDGVSDMIESGRLTEADIPDDYEWLTEQLSDFCNIADHKAEDAIAKAKGDQS